MRKTEFPVIKDIVLLGGGHAHVSVLRNFGMFPIKGVRLTLISPESDTPYSGMLPGLIAGHYTFDEAHIDLGPLARFAGARYLETQASRIDPELKLVHCADGRPPIPYDVLSINTGSTPVFDDQLELGRNVIPVKPVSEFLKQWAGLKRRVLTEPGRRVGVVGAGAGGIELLLSIQHALELEAGTSPGRGPGALHLFTRDDGVLKTHGATVRDAFRTALSERNITVHAGFDVVRADPDGVSDGVRTVELDEVIWVTGAEPPTWPAASGLNVDGNGFVVVDDHLQSTSHQDVYGAGDVVSMVHDPRPKSGVFAVRQGPILAYNLRARMLNQPLKRYRPQRAFLSLISTGDKNAIASYAGWSVKGAWVWRWKDRIDRAFMRRFNELPRMTEKPEATIPVVAGVSDEVAEAQLPEAMRCGGCGAKVGSATLQRALAQIPGITTGKMGTNHGIVLGVGDDAAAIDVPAGHLLVQTVDSFPAMIDDPFTFGQISANHCLGDIYAMGAIPHSTLVIVSLPFAPDTKREADLVQLLAGAKTVFDAAGCSIVGGHTSEGRELTLGFSINGLAKHDALMRKGGLSDGMALVLTKPIGSGVLFAGHGRGQAKGRWVRAAVENALQSSAQAAEILRAHGAQAMTDVTGFGIAGHLGEMLTASNVMASIRLNDVPLLVGAEDIVKRGIVSSLQSANLGWRREVEAAGSISRSPEFQLLFDPQTAGGLLAGLPMDKAEAAVAALRDAGYARANAIGETATAEGTCPMLRLI